MKICIKNARLWTGEAEFARGCVQVEGNRIVYAGEEALAPCFAAEETIDAQGGIVTPAFYNSHSHAAMTLLRGAGSDKPLMDWLGVINPIEDRLSDEIVYAGSMAACMEMLRRGCVCFNDMYMFMEATAKAARDTGMRALLGRGVVSEDRLESNIELFEHWHGKAEGRVRVAITPYAEYGVSEELYRKCVDAAQRLDAVLHTHASETEYEVQACRERHRGLTPVRLLREMGMFSRHCVAAHCVWVDDEEIDILAENGVYVSHNPASNCKLGSGVAPVVKMLEKGVRLSLGTDGAASNNGLDMLADLRLASLLQKAVQRDASALNANASLSMATRGGALACGLGDAGLLKEGYLADLVIFDAQAENLLPVFDVPSAVVFAAQGLNVRMTMVDGRFVYREGVFPLFDADAALAAAREASRVLLG
ncbi:MAG: amidohydrolase [Eubacteriales bacterium]|nr:amidohydrolase [Eubacteriales bacterium]